jgi:hypothetical protein
VHDLHGQVPCATASKQKAIDLLRHTREFSEIKCYLSYFAPYAASLMMVMLSSCGVPSTDLRQIFAGEHIDNAPSTKNGAHG